MYVQPATQGNIMTLDELKDYLDSDDNQYGLDSIATHGFLVATIVGKPLPNWMSLLFEGQDADVDESVKQAITAWRDNISEALKNEEGVDLPLELDEDSSEMDFSPESELSAWSVGFVDAMYGDENVDWFSEEQTEEDVAMLTLPMIIFSGIDMAGEDGIEDENFAKIRQDEDALAQMADSIERNVTELYLLFHTDE